MIRYRREDITPEFLADLKYALITPEELEDVLTLARTIYPEEELQRHLEVDRGIPFEQVLREVEEMARQRDEKGP